jgi:hypothetical protein
MTGKHSRTGLILLTALLGAALTLPASCGREEESLKIVIEDSTDTEAPKPKDDGDVVKTTPETVPGLEPGMDAPPPGEGPGTPPETTGAETALAMKVSEVMAKAVADDDFKKFAAAVPLRVTIFGLPKNRAWSVKTMFRNVTLMEVVIDDNSGNILKRDVKREKGIENLAEKEGPGARRLKEHMGALRLGYAGALDAALKDGRFPEIDYTGHVALAVLLGPGREGPTWHVVFMTGEGEKNTVAVIDDYGNVLGVREEEKRVKR